MPSAHPARMSGRVRSSSSRLLAAVLIVLGVVGATGAPAGALTPNPVFPGVLGAVPFNVSGSYTPLPLLCGPDLDIFWYAPGPAADFIWSGIDVSGPSMTYANRPTSVSGVYVPLVGDFDGDSCDDIFWYAPGSGADYVWYNDGASTFSSRPVAVNGWYRPIVNFFDGDLSDDIYWYAPGSGAESMWVGGAGRTMTGARAPQVNGDYLPMPFLEGGVLWYGSGAAPDAITAVTAGSTRPDLNLQTRIDELFTPVPFWASPLLYAPGRRTDHLVVDAAISGSQADLLTVRGTINGVYRIGTTAGGPVAVLHAPGSATDQLMYDLPEAAAVSEGPTDWSHLRRRSTSAADALTDD